MGQNPTIDREPKLQKSLPAVYVTFECVGKREPRRAGESRAGVWLRLHNNLRWALSVPGFSVERSFASKDQDESEAVLYYEVENTNTRPGNTRYREVPEKGLRIARKQSRIPEAPIGYRMTDLVKRIPLASGDSVLFSIPYEHLKKDLVISASFRFEWEEVMDNARHRVYFYGSDLPDKDVRQCR